MLGSCVGGEAGVGGFCRGVLEECHERRLIGFVGGGVRRRGGTKSNASSILRESEVGAPRETRDSFGMQKADWFRTKDVRDVKGPARLEEGIVLSDLEAWDAGVVSERISSGEGWKDDALVPFVDDFHFALKSF